MNQEELRSRMAFVNEEREKRYQALETEEKLLINISELGHQASFGLERKSGQKRALMTLNECGEMNQRELGHRLGIQPGSLSEVLRKLEDAELIRRLPDPADRRGMRVALTEEGKLIAEHAAAKKKEETAGLFDMLETEEREELLALLEKVNAEWKTRYGRPLPPEPDRPRRRPPFGGMPCPDGPMDFPSMPGPERPEDFRRMPSPDAPFGQGHFDPRRDPHRRRPYDPADDGDMI